MAKNRLQQTVRLAIERLEAREVPAGGPWLSETFEQTPTGSLPSGWFSHTSNASGSFAASDVRALGSETSIRTQGNSKAETRTWAETVIPADAQVSAHVYVDSLIPAQVLSRGQDLETDHPSYYSVAVTRGLQVKLLRVVDGQSTELASLRSSSWLSNKWVRVSLTTVGDDIYVQIFRTDTAQYLNSEGRWQSTAANAIHEQDQAIAGPGNAGLARSALHAGLVYFDQFKTAPPPTGLSRQTLAEESFTRPVPGGLPAGWVQWGDRATMRVSTASSLTQSAALRAGNANAGAVRSWLNVDQPADIDVAAMVIPEGLAPAQVIIRGQNLNSSAPTYYAASVIRGLELQLQRVVDGQSTVIDSIRSNQWVGSQWVQITLSAEGNRLRVMAYRTDTAQYLNQNGNWQADEDWALEAIDSAITGGGKVGLGRDGGIAGMVTFDNLTVTQAVAEAPPTIPTVPTSEGVHDFDATPVGGLPSEWSSWSNNSSGGFGVTDEHSLSSPHGLMSGGSSDLNARAWLGEPNGPDVQVGAAVYLDSLVPAQIIVRGQDLDTESPSYYAASVTRGLDVQIQRVVNGQATVLSTLSSNTWDSNLWVRLNLTAEGDTFQVQVIRLDSGEYLNEEGDWQTDPTIAIGVNDTAIMGGGAVGLSRPASYSGRLFYDNFSAHALVASAPPVDRPPINETPVTPDPTAPPVNAPPVANNPPPTTAPPVSIPPTDGVHSAPPPVTNTAPPPVSAQPSALPLVPSHYSHIRIAQFAYHGTPIGAFEQKLIRESVDLIIPNTDYLDDIAAISKATPQFIYSNASNIYRELLTDWLNFADAKGYDREAAFYHVSKAQAFTGDSASSWPVEWFWNVMSGSDGKWKNVTSQARSASDELKFGPAGDSLMIGNTEKYREINFTLASGASDGWTGDFEYATAVDANGAATAWKKLTTISDGTVGFTRTGQVTFDPPADWVASSINGGPRLHYVRVHTRTDGTAPVAQKILGRDYVNAQGRGEGMIPAFDKSADADGDGYLNNAEYANRKSGMDARFVYESRAFYPAYGQNRFATNVANPLFREWAADYSYRFLSENPDAKGLFMDNSLSKIAFDPATISESLANYADNYAEVLAAINKRFRPMWVLANVAGGGDTGDALAKRGISYLDEFVIRPMAASYSQFEDVASNLKRRLDLSNGKAYAILDSLATNGSISDPRVQIGTLAYYYLLADPEQTMLVFNGGNDPNSAWSKHWSDAVRFDVGDPLAEWTPLATGKDPANTTMTYKVYQREYENALVLYKPLSYYRGQAGSTADNTATTHMLNGKYRPLNADGTLGTVVNKVTLRNGEGAILVKV